MLAQIHSCLLLKKPPSRFGEVHVRGFEVYRATSSRGVQYLASEVPLYRAERACTMPMTMPLQTTILRAGGAHVWKTHQGRGTDPLSGPMRVDLLHLRKCVPFRSLVFFDLPP